MSNEYELKFLNVRKETVRDNLAAQGYQIVKTETLLQRQTYHLPKHHPEHDFKWGRVRNEGDKITATIKWYADPANISISNVHEEEVTVSRWEEGVAWITSKEFTPTAYQENYREAWAQGNVEIAIDTWPGLAPYIEIEAPSVAEVEEAAQALGYNPASGVAGGTEIIYERELGIPAKVIKSLPRITFEEPPA